MDAGTTLYECRECSCASCVSIRLVVRGEGGVSMRMKRVYAIFISLSFLLAVIQPGMGAISIPGNTSVGHWNGATRTYTLTRDLTEPIEIVSDGVTLDGAGHTLISSGIPLYAGGAVSLYGRTGVTIKNLTIKRFGPGIYLFGSSGNTLTGNTVSDCSVSGIYLFNSSNNTLTANTVSKSSWGVFVNCHSNGNVLTGNATTNHWRGGIILSNNCDRNTLTRNTASNNMGSGIILWDDCNTNTVTGNTVASNKEHGVWLVRSHLNQVYNNNFVGNTKQASVRDGSGNVFSLPAPCRGNYWSNWTSPGDAGCGFADSPYVFLCGQDDLPWAVPNGWDLLEIAREMLQVFAERVAVSNLSDGLDVRIKAALGALDDVNDNDNAAAVDSLEALVGAVEALRGNKISEEDAGVLVTAAQQIIDLLAAG